MSIQDTREVAAFVEVEPVSSMVLATLRDDPAVIIGLFSSRSGYISTETGVITSNSTLTITGHRREGAVITSRVHGSHIFTMDFYHRSYANDYVTIRSTIASDIRESAVAIGASAIYMDGRDTREVAGITGILHGGKLFDLYTKDSCIGTSRINNVSTITTDLLDSAVVIGSSDAAQSLILDVNNGAVIASAADILVTFLQDVREAGVVGSQLTSVQALIEDLLDDARIRSLLSSRIITAVTTFTEPSGESLPGTRDLNIGAILTGVLNNGGRC